MGIIRAAKERVRIRKEREMSIVGGREPALREGAISKDVEEKAGLRGTYTFHMVSVACCNMFVASPTISNPSVITASPTRFLPPFKTGIVPKLIHPDWSPQTLTNIVRKNPTIPERDDGRWR
jgi:hypothetical protein